MNHLIQHKNTVFRHIFIYLSILFSFNPAEKSYIDYNGLS